MTPNDYLAYRTGLYVVLSMFEAAEIQKYSCRQIKHRPGLRAKMSFSYLNAVQLLQSNLISWLRLLQIWPHKPGAAATGNKISSMFWFAKLIPYPRRLLGLRLHDLKKKWGGLSRSARALKVMNSRAFYLQRKSQDALRQHETGRSPFGLHGAAQALFTKRSPPALTYKLHQFYCQWL